MKWGKRNIPATNKTGTSWLRLLYHWTEQRFALFFHHVVNPMPLKKKKWLLLLFCGFMTTYSGFLIHKGLLGHQRAVITIHRLAAPFVVQQTGRSPRTVRTQADLQRISRIHDYLDSLKYRHPTTYDSLLRLRPFMLDSLRLLDSIYHLKK